MDKFRVAWAVIIVVLAIFILLRSARLSMPPFVLITLVVGMLLVGIAPLLWQLSGERVVTLALLVVFIEIVILSVYGSLHREIVQSSELDGKPQGKRHETLFVLIHGLGGADTWKSLKPELGKHGRVLQLDYRAGPMSNADPEEIAGEMDKLIANAWAGNHYDRLVLVGHSLGALLARRTYLIAAKRDDSWANRDNNRIVLLAGMNRGWDVSGEKPMDMSFGKRLYFIAGAWFARLTGTGRLMLQVETGSPFVANLRLQWMKWFQQERDHAPLVVQLLGDIDDVVSDEDNQDLRAVADGNPYYWLRVRGTGHASIVEIDDVTGKTDSYDGIGAYRKSKILLAVAGRESDIKAASEELPFQTNPCIRHIVFVLHGIRDLGEWSAGFEQKLRKRAPKGGLAVVSARYGYFSMGSFLFRPDRQKYVRWFMDQYTEVRARYPNATRIDFIGHSNGTYLLASALSQYSEMEIDRIVFGGSVVRRDYDWNELMPKRVKAVRNYISTDDSVVAVFPRFFEPWGKKGLFGNDVGSAGFNGFDHPPPFNFEQIEIGGGHSAFLDVAAEIADFIMAPQRCDKPSSRWAEESAVAGTWTTLLGFHSSYAFVLVPALILAAVLFPAVRVATAGGHQAWVYLAGYALLVVALLTRL